MNRKSSFRRAAAAIAGAVIGLAFLAPANAAEPAPGAELTATSSCDGGGWMATWRLTTANTNGADGIFSDFVFKTDSSAYAGIKGLPPLTPTFFAPNGKASGDNDFTEDWPAMRIYGAAEMTFTVTWHNGADVHTAHVSAKALAPTDCDWPPPPPPPTPTPRASASNSPAAQPSPSASAGGTPVPATGGSGGGLPVTGAAAGTVAGVAAVLLAAGGVLLLVARRRRVKYIA